MDEPAPERPPISSDPAVTRPPRNLTSTVPAVPAAGFPRVSIVVPVYNERDNLRPLHDEVAGVMAASGTDFELLLVDDASTDGSDAVLDVLLASDARVRALRLDRHEGQTSALAAGFRAARGGILVTMDGDLQNDPADIPRMLEALADHDAVVGWRAVRRDSRIRRISSRCGNRVRNLLSGDDIVDTGCSLRVCRRAAIERIKLFDGMHRFLPTLLRMEGFRVIQMSVNHRPRRAGRSKYNLRNRVLRTAADLLAIMWMRRRVLRARAHERKAG